MTLVGCGYRLGELTALQHRQGRVAVTHPRVYQRLAPWDVGPVARAACAPPDSRRRGPAPPGFPVSVRHDRRPAARGSRYA